MNCRSSNLTVLTFLFKNHFVRKLHQELLKISVLLLILLQCELHWNVFYLQNGQTFSFAYSLFTLSVGHTVFKWQLNEKPFSFGFLQCYLIISFFSFFCTSHSAFIIPSILRLGIEIEQNSCLHVKTKRERERDHYKGEKYLGWGQSKLGRFDY